jgi:hypothetical protein
VNQDYEAVAFCAKPQDAADAEGYRTYSFSMPVSELTERQNAGTGEQGIDVLLTQPNGVRYRWRSTYDSAALKPGDEIPLSKPETMWQGY